MHRVGLLLHLLKEDSGKGVVAGWQEEAPVRAEVESLWEVQVAMVQPLIRDYSHIGQLKV